MGPFCAVHDLLEMAHDADDDDNDDDDDDDDDLLLLLLLCTSPLLPVPEKALWFL